MAISIQLPYLVESPTQDSITKNYLLVNILRIFIDLYKFRNKYLNFNWTLQNISYHLNLSSIFPPIYPTVSSDDISYSSIIDWCKDYHQEKYKDSLEAFNKEFDLPQQQHIIDSTFTQNLNDIICLPPSKNFINFLSLFIQKRYEETFKSMIVLTPHLTDTLMENLNSYIHYNPSKIPAEWVFEQPINNHLFVVYLGKDTNKHQKIINFIKSII